jgi:hypothetical protein
MDATTSHRRKICPHLHQGRHRRRFPVSRPSPEATKIQCPAAVECSRLHLPFLPSLTLR